MELPSSIARWAFASEKVVRDKAALHLAESSLAQEPTNSNANALMAISFLDDDGSNEIFSSTISLFASVVYGAITGFSDFSVSESLTFTQEALRRAAGSPAVIPASTIQSQKIKTPVRVELQQILLMARIRAISRLSQVDTAKKDAVSLLPEAFAFASIQGDTGAHDSRSCNDIDVQAATVLEETQDLLFLLPLDSTSEETVFLRLAISILLATRCYNEAIRVCEQLIKVLPAPSSWLLATKAWACVCNLLREEKLRGAALGVCHPHSKHSDRNTVIAEELMSPMIRELQAALKIDSDPSAGSEISALIRFRIGACLFLAGGRFRANSFTFLSESAKGLQSGEVFTYLGHYFAQEVSSGEQLDRDKAVKCYLSALKMDPLSEEAGWGLSEIYMSGGDDGHSKAEALWTEMLSFTTHAFWCYPLQGQNFLCKGLFEKAAECFQKAIELQPLDAVCWYGLGFCYLSQSSYVAAEKALLVANGLRPKDTTVLCLLGDARQKLCRLEESLECYNRTLDLDSRDVLALKGRADINLAKAYQYYSLGSMGQVARSLSEGIQSVEIALHPEFTIGATESVARNDSPSSSAVTEVRSDCERRRGGDLRSLWKVLGDLCTFSRNIGPSDVATFITTSSENVPGTTSSSRNIPLSGLGTGDALPSHSPLLVVLEKGEKAYRKVLQIAEDSGSADSACYFDVGCALYSRAVAVLQSHGQGSGILPPSDAPLDSPSVDLFVQAKEFFTKGLRLDPLNGQCWNGLGLTLLNGRSDNSAAAAQACFVRATQIDANAPAFANLGVLLMMSDKDDCARKCFSALQQIESNPVIWASLGCVFERKEPESGSDGEPPTTRTMDLLSATDSYIAAIEIAKPSEALLGSALAWLNTHPHLRSSAVLSAGGKYVSCAEHDQTLIDIRHEVEGPLLRFLRRRSVHPLAWAQLAWCYEVRGAYSSAVQSLTHALNSLDTILSPFCSASPSSSSSTSSTSFSSRHDAPHVAKNISKSNTTQPEVSKEHSLESADGLLRLQNILLVLLRNYQRCSGKSVLYGNSITVNEKTAGNVLQWVLTLKSILGVVGENKLTSLVSSVVSDDSMSSSLAGVTKNQESKFQESSSSGLAAPGIIIREAHARIETAVSLYLRAIAPHRASITDPSLSDGALENLQAAWDRVTSLARTRRVDTDSCDAVVRLIGVCNMMCRTARVGLKEKDKDEEGEEGGGGESEDPVHERFRVAARNVLRSIAWASLLTDPDPFQRATEPSTCIDIALANCPHSLLCLSRSFSVKMSVEEDSNVHGGHVRTATQLLRTGIKMWHQTNSFLNLELGQLLFQTLTGRSQKNGPILREAENREEEESEESVFEEACHSSSVAVKGAAACLAVSMSSAAEDLSVQRKRERRVVLNVERSRVPALYQQCTELEHRLDCARERMKITSSSSSSSNSNSKTNNAVSSSSADGSGTNTEAGKEYGGGALLSDAPPTHTAQREGVESGFTIPFPTPCERSYRLYLRGVHWMPSLASSSLMK